MYRQSVIIPVYIETFLGLSDAYSVQQRELWHVPRQHVEAACGSQQRGDDVIVLRLIFCSVLLAPSTPQPPPTPPSTAVSH